MTKTIFITTAISAVLALSACQNGETRSEERYDPGHKATG